MDSFLSLAAHSYSFVDLVAPNSTLVVQWAKLYGFCFDFFIFLSRLSMFSQGMQKSLEKFYFKVVLYLSKVSWDKEKSLRKFKAVCYTKYKRPAAKSMCMKALKKRSQEFFITKNIRQAACRCHYKLFCVYPEA